MSFTFKPPRPGEDNYFTFPSPPPYRYWLKGERLCELQGRRDALQKEGKVLEGADFIEYKRLRGKQDFYYFAKYIAGVTWLEWPLHGPVAWAWSAPNGYRDPSTGKRFGRFRLGVFARAHLKTTLLTQAYCMYRLAKDPEERILIYTSTYDFAGTIMNYIRTTFEGGGRHGELFLQCYGDMIPKPSDRTKWTTNDLTLIRRGAYSDPSIKARGIGSRVVGGHHTIQLLDDLMVEELSRPQVDKVVRELDALDPLYHSVALGERRYVGTPWAFYDPIVHITRGWKDALVVRIPWRDAAGAPIFTYKEADIERGLPEGTSLKEYTVYAEGMKRRNAWFFSCQYECYPADEDRIGFKKEWFRYFTMKAGKFLEVDRDEKETGKSVRVAECNTFILIDPNVIDPPGSRASLNTNVEVRRQGDFAAWVVVCVSPDNYWYIPRVIRWRCNVDQFLLKTHELVAVWQPKFVAIEQVAAQRLFYHLFVRDWREGKPKFSLEPWAGGHASKPTRIRGLIPNYSNGFILHRLADQPEITQGIVELEGELLDGESAENDDASDALSAAVPLVYPPGKDRSRQLDSALNAIKRDARWSSLDPNSRAEAVAWERKKSKGMLIGDDILKGVSMDDYDDEDYMTGLVPNEAWGVLQ